jgi:hypothetical protein
MPITGPLCDHAIIAAGIRRLIDTSKMTSCDPCCGAPRARSHHCLLLLKSRAFEFLQTPILLRSEQPTVALNVFRRSIEKKPIVSIPLLHLPKLDLSKRQMDQPDLFKRHFVLLLQEVLFPFVLEPLEKPTHRLTNLSSNLQTLLQKLHTADNYRPIPSSLDVVLILFFVFSSVMFSEFSLLKRMQGTS